MTKFPYITLGTIQRTADKVGCLSTQENELEQQLANELVLLSEMFVAKVQDWADGIRRKNDPK